METLLLYVEQTQFFYALAGTRLYLLSGKAQVIATSRWSGMPVFESDLPLFEGDSLLLRRDGWILIRAKQQSELVCIFPLSLPRRLLNWWRDLHSQEEVLLSSR